METRKLLLLAIVLTFILTINTAYALPLWQFGIEDQSYSEFKSNPGGSFEPETIIGFGSVSVDDPSMYSGFFSPGYLYTSNHPLVDTASTASLTFEFTLTEDYRQLDLSYGRMGAEIDDVYFDGVKIFSADGTAEGQYDLFEYAITGEIYAGDHTLTVAYADDAGNGHYIDFMRLDNGDLLNGRTNSIPEPGTIFLVGTGILGLVSGCRRKIK